MLERLFSLFSDSATSNRGDDGDDPKVAAAALLFHVMDADGERSEEERVRLTQSLSETYGLSDAELDRVLEAGEAADREAVDLYAFTSVIKRELDEQGRLDFIRLMWEVAFADGVMHELEDNTVWRVAELIGISNRERILLRQDVASARGIDIKG
ncbi:MAG: TerB family tellurite resistance protein [Zhengella sp.]|uniref:tellurite resistance TerB family protein n=1 Tax=Zhengella sp. TaxID=2282762 RepID=UPI001DDBD311|nr:TerB family tellurite resistance protein [Notoacmeibacter sp.]